MTDDRIRRNLDLIGFGFLMTLFSSFGQTFYISLFAGQIQAGFGLSHGGFGAYYSAATLVSAVCLLWTGKEVDRRELRRISTAVMAGLAAACALMAVAHTVHALLLALFLLRHFGQGLMGHVASSTTARYFAGSRGRALSVVILGHAVGEAALPPLAVATLAWVSWRQSWLAIALSLTVLIPLTVWWLLRRHPVRHSAFLSAAKAAAGGASRAVAARHWTRSEVARDPLFYLMLPGVLAPAFIITGLLFHQVHIAGAKDWSLAWLASTYLGYALASLLGTLGVGWVIDRFSALKVFPCALLPLLLSGATLALTSAPLSAWLYMGAAGLCAGIVMTLSSALWAELYGVLHIGAIRALTSALAVLSSAGGPVLFGALFDRGASVAQIAWGCVSYLAAATLLNYLSARLHARRRRG